MTPSPRFPLFDRAEERSRLERLMRRQEGALAVLYGRRRCGKSRLLREVLPEAQTVFFVGDDRESALQRVALAKEIARTLEGFDRVDYPDWDTLFERFWQSAPPGTFLVIDELPALVSRAQEIPSLLQKWIDHPVSRGIHLFLAGSSQRMMQGLVLDRSAPLYGRAKEILKIRPLQAGWIVDALQPPTAIEGIGAFALWGGVPRYWELAVDFSDNQEAFRDLVLSPLGPLYEEPQRLLLDDLRDTAQASSILSLIGAGCSRPSEIAGRLGKPASSLARPLQRLLEMELILRETPYGAPPRKTKRTLYRIADPFLRSWFRFVEPNRSRLEARLLDRVESDVQQRMRHHVAEVWEELARASVPWLEGFDTTWEPAGRWWGNDLDRRPVEIDVVAESTDGNAVLVGEVKWSRLGTTDLELDRLRYRAERLPFVRGREVHPVLWIAEGPDSNLGRVVRPAEVLAALR